jgi:hypothetical protein
MTSVPVQANTAAYFGERGCSWLGCARCREEPAFTFQAATRQVLAPHGETDF